MPTQDSTTARPTLTSTVQNRSFGLDFLRAVAIGMVVSCHCGILFGVILGRQYPMRLAISGFFGVELFFVLSGFLIGRILLDILDRGASLRAWRIFLVRRWMRTLPLYYTVVVLLVIVWPPQPALPRHEFAAGLVWFATLTQNLAWPMMLNWFTVSWSLGVEEWFYVLFPTALFVAAAACGRRAALAVTIGLFLVLPLALRWHVTTVANWNEVTSKVVFCRLDAIGFGVAAAWAMRRLRPARLRDLGLLIAGVTLVALQWGEWTHVIFMSDRARGALMFNVVSVGFVLCLPFAVGWEGRGLSILRPGIVWLSRLAYPLYLTHLSLLEMIAVYGYEWRVPAWILIAVSLPAIFVLAWALNWFVEQPIMALRPPQPAGRATARMAMR